MRDLIKTGWKIDTRQVIKKVILMTALSAILPLAYAAPASGQKLDLALSEHSKAKIKRLMNDPKIW